MQPPVKNPFARFMSVKIRRVGKEGMPWHLVPDWVPSLKLN